MRFLLSALMLFIFTSACGMRFIKVDNPQLIASYVDKIESYNSLVNQIKASLDIKAFGMLGSVIHERSDVVVKSPHYLFWSLRSFFGPPAFLLASNGEKMTIFDFSGQSSKTYQEIVLRHDSFFELMDFRFHPQSIIDILLAKIPLNRAKNIVFTSTEERLEITAELPNGWQLTSLFDHRFNRVIETRLANKNLSASFQAKYDNFQSSEGIFFPRSIVLFAKGKSRFLRLHIEFLQIEINGAEVLRDVFYLKPH